MFSTQKSNFHPKINISEYNLKLSDIVKKACMGGIAKRDWRMAQEAINLYEEIKNDATSYTHNIMLNLFSHFGKIEMSIIHFNEVMKDTKTPEEYKINAQSMMLYALANAPQITQEIVKQAKDFYLIIDGSGCDKYGVSTENYKDSIMVQLFARLGDIENAWYHFRKMGDYADKRHFKSVLLSVYVHANEITSKDFDEAKSLFQRIGKSANDDDKKTILKIYSRKTNLSYQDLQDAESIYLNLKTQNDITRQYLLKIYANTSMTTYGSIENIRNKAQNIFDSKENKIDKTWMELMHKINNNAEKAAIEIEIKNKASEKLAVYANYSQAKIADKDLEEANSLFRCLGKSASEDDKKNIQKIYATHANMEVQKLLQSSAETVLVKTRFFSPKRADKPVEDKNVNQKQNQVGFGFHQ